MFTLATELVEDLVAIAGEEMKGDAASAEMATAYAIKRARKKLENSMEKFSNMSRAWKEISETQNEKGEKCTRCVW